MPFFQYQATDSAGRSIEGTLQATTADAARDALIQAGLRAVTVGGGIQTTAPAPKVAPTVAPTVAPMIVNVPAPSPTGQVVRTAKGTDKDRFFLFSQMASAFRAGVSPVQLFHQLKLNSKPNFSQSFDALERGVSEGRLMSDIMALYPDLYPPHVTAMVRAGEAGGFLPDALEEVSRQAESAHSFRRFFFWTWFVAINALLSVPLAYLGGRAVLDDYDAVMKAGGNVDGVGAMTQSFWHVLLWPVGPISLAIYAGLFLFRRRMQSDAMTHARHRLAMTVPVLAKRAREEGFARFSFALARLSAAGISPGRAWALAADSVPNMELRDRIATSGSTWMEGRDKLSDLMTRSGVFPVQYGQMISTAELTGDIPGALANLSTISQREFEIQTKAAKISGGSAGCTTVIVTGGIAIIILCWFWYHDLYGKVAKDFDSDTPMLEWRLDR